MPDRTGKRKLWTYLVPMLNFVGVSGALKRPGASLWLSAPELWIYPLQTVLCAALLASFWREYEFHPWRRPLFTLAIALVVFALWIITAAVPPFPDADRRS